ncbi:putative RING finger domain protein [Aspergillus candidus]|uniref:RING-type E3 ubiquitin transferase n=1 Tax=Aspergillus candidus TaxID=41067 RepID=A0A2I2FHQ7_ASPCN|nr:hypothetical protein BDW47DRAFT_92743 [Aspergillus candidus]PLB40165.1 hypothetical protein BDW47DRAFT_92743 [Aspergillus candidus]
MADARDRVFCHACGGVWLRDEHGLECPHCQSDFTEIVEIPPDPEAEVPDPPEAFPEEPRPPPRRANTNPWADHNPWAHQDDDPDEWGPGDGLRTHNYRSPDGRFTFTSTTFNGGFGPQRSGGQRSRQAQPDPLMPVMWGLDRIFHGLADTYQQQNHPRSGPGSAPEAGTAPPPWVAGGMFRHGHDFDTHHDDDTHGSYAGGPGLRPRDTDGPQPQVTPLRTLGDILEQLQDNLGNRQTGMAGAAAGGAHFTTGTHPLALLSTLLNFDRHGDAVYSQEELDRVISQLVEQNAGGTAPPPASQNAISSLPKKPVDKEMLGHEGKAECSICMDAVDIGTEVTVLPCTHWFHYTCIEMWLNQHNTCPHCRRPIDIPNETEPGRSR